MKTKIVIVIGLLSMGANAAITLSGNALTKPFNSTGSAVVATGSLAMLIVDTTGNGFIDLGTVAGGTTTLTNPGLTIANMSSTVGGSFGGDTVAAVYSIGGTGIPGTLSLPTNSTFFGKQFAMVFFDTSSITAGSKYGIARGTDWTFPVTDTGAGIAFNNTDASGAASYYQITSTAPTANQTSGGFYSGASNSKVATTFSIIPEPSAALLGAVGALVLLRRRRI